jgi:molybdopterin synthase catalytic subunit
MQVRVLFFGRLAELAGRRSETAALPDFATVADLMSHYGARIPELAKFSGSLAVSVNLEYATSATHLNNGDEIALLPPVSGGAIATKTPGATRVSIVREPIQTQAVVEALKRPEDGACCVFEGIVRNQTRGRKTLYLDYEAYEPMALGEMERLVTDAKKGFQIRDCAIIHRLGRMEIGEASVLIAVASAHRAAAFDACRWLIDNLKKTVPIWKKEYFADGAVWADGEPFPDEVRLRSDHS